MRIRIVLTLVALTLPTVSVGAIPKLVGELQLAGPVTQITFDRDGKRAVAETKASNGQPGEIQIVDTSIPEKPVVVGSIEIARNGDMALSPHGRRLLLLSRLGTKTYAQATRHEVIAFDLSDPKRIKKLWSREFEASVAAVAPDASAYVDCQRSTTNKDVWQNVITWVGTNRPPTIVNQGQYPFFPLSPPFLRLTFSEHASFLLIARGAFLQVFDLRAAKPVLYEQQETAPERYWPSAALVSENGTIVIPENHFHRLGIYASEKGVPRVATLSLPGVDVTKLRMSMHGTDLFTDHPLSAGFRRVRRFDLSMPNAPRATGSWRLPPHTHPIPIFLSDSIHLYARAGRSLDVYRVDMSQPPTVNWKELEAVHRAALRIYQQSVSPLHGMRALDRFEGTEIHEAIRAPVSGISPKVAAAILNDYGFLLGDNTYPTSPDAALYIRRALELDPSRTIAYLNLADLLRGTLPNVTDWKVKQARSREIRGLYRQYIKRGGKPTENIDEFLRGDLGKDHPDDICRVIANYANAGRLQELISTSATDVAVGNRRFDLVFTAEGSADFPVINAFDAKTGWYVDNNALTPDIRQMSPLDQLGLVVYRNFYQILRYRDKRHPIASASLSGDQHCEFQVTTKEVMSPEALEPALCEQLLAGQGPQAIKFNKPVQMTSKDVSERYGATGIDGAQMIDVANDGKPINVGRFSVALEGGPGCNEEFFDQVDGTAAHFESGSEHDLLMKLEGANSTSQIPLEPCDNQPRFFMYRGKTYFENKPDTWPPIDKENQYHRVAQVDQGKVVDVCGFTFVSRVRGIRSR